MSKKLTAPDVEKKPFEVEVNGNVRVDDYYWLREKTNVDVLAYLAAENAYREQELAHLEGLREKLFAEMVGRIQETDDSVPVREGEYYYYTRTEEGKQYGIYCRKLGMEGAEEILLDLNQIDDENDFAYLSLGIYQVSPQHDLLAFGLDTTGAETYTIQFKHLGTGELLTDVIENAAGSAEWGDNTTLFYTTEEANTKRSDKLYRHILGEGQSADVLMYHEPDQLYNVYPYKTNDKRYLFVGSLGIETYEWHYLDTDVPLGDFKLFAAREKGLRYDVEHRAGTFYIVTNADGAVNSKLMTTPVTNTQRGSWQTLIPHREEVRLYNIEMFAQYLVRSERINGLTQLVVTQFDGFETHTIDFDEEIYTVGFGANAEYDSQLVRLTYTSLVTPATVYDYHMGQRTLELKKRTPVLGGYDTDQYTTKRILATADDGVKVPISLVYRKDAWQGQPTTLHLYGYGSYGVTVDPSFSSARVSLLDRGVVFAVAHVRGSQIFGRKWYENGKFLHKRNTFTDFIACAKHLIAQNYTEPAKMTIEGRSAGGLLVGAVLNLASQLFKAAVAGVPFVDVVTTMLDETIPLTVGEFDEWGNPKDPKYYDYMLSYSPYDNVTAQDYPAILVTAGLNDPRVQYWEPAKWVAKLRDLKTDNNPLLLKMHMGAGHFASSGRYDLLKDVAHDYAFLLDQLGLAK